MRVACSQICVLEVNVVQTARTLTPAQKTKNHCLKEDHFVDVGRAMGVKQLVAMEELVVAEDQVVVGRQLVAKEQVLAEEPVVAEEQVVAKEQVVAEEQVVVGGQLVAEDPVVTGEQLVAEEKVMAGGKGAKNCLQGLFVYICICMYVRWSVDVCVCAEFIIGIFLNSFAVIVLVVGNCTKSRAPVLVSLLRKHFPVLRHLWVLFHIRTRSAKTPIKVLQLFLTGMLLQSIVTQSNNFAASKGAVLNLCSEELLAFIGMNIAMGLLRLPQVRDYWATDEILSTPWFPSIMPRDRFF